MEQVSGHQQTTERVSSPNLPARLEALAQAGMDGQWNARGTIEKLWREEMAPLVRMLGTAQILADAVRKHSRSGFLVDEAEFVESSIGSALARLERRP